ncbi:MAG: hypothetical protein J5753_01085 [Oscillospiraceae bacterium]|nr:hypothetical protein [Oscillospiraceae bacterium]
MEKRESDVKIYIPHLRNSMSSSDLNKQPPEQNPPAESPEQYPPEITCKGSL